MRTPALLIVGGESDPNTQRIVDQAHLHELDYVFWNSDNDFCRQIAWDFSTPTLDLGDLSLAPKAVFLRYNVFDSDPFQNRSCFDTIQSYVLAWPKIRILNRATLTDANNKSKNLRIAIDSGFAIPATTVLGDLTPLATLPDAAAKAVKPLGGGAHTKNAQAMLDENIQLDQIEPQFIQERLEGENLRVFAIDEALYCFHLKTEMLDYREDHNVDVYQVETPKELVAPIHHFVKQLGFDYCALDFRCRRGWSSPVFLEVNSFPMFVRFDDAGSNCIADKILQFLTF